MFSLLPYTAPDFTEKRFTEAPEIRTAPAPADAVAPEGFHATSIFPEYFKLGGQWLPAAESRVDCVPVLEDGKILVKEFRRLKKGETVVLGRSENAEDGIFVHTDGFPTASAEEMAFSFRGNRTRETAFARDYDELVELLRYEKDHGKIVWVLGPAFCFDAEARAAMSSLIRKGYAHAVLAGNALATHDLEGSYLGTALGQDLYTRRSMPNGHYNHLDTINRVKLDGSIPAFLEREGIREGIIASCVESGVPFVLCGSIRDDGPLPEVCGNVYDAQDAMRAELRDATTVICLATMLHTIAVGNTTPSFRVLPDGTFRQIYFYCVDVSEFVINKLADRGSLTSRGIVSNVHDFAVLLEKRLG